MSARHHTYFIAGSGETRGEMPRLLGPWLLFMFVAYGWRSPMGPARTGYEGASIWWTSRDDGSITRTIRVVTTAWDDVGKRMRPATVDLSSDDIAAATERADLDWLRRDLGPAMLLERDLLSKESSES